MNAWGVPAWFKMPSKRILSGAFVTSPSRNSIDTGVSEVVSTGGVNVAHSGSSELGYSVLDAKESADPRIVDKFRASFAFGEKEQLLGCKS